MYMKLLLVFYMPKLQYNYEAHCLGDFKLTLTNHSRLFNMHLNLSTSMFLHFAPHQSDATVAEKQAHNLKLKSSKKKMCYWLVKHARWQLGVQTRH